MTNKVLNNLSLLQFNTFQVDVKADYFLKTNSKNELISFLVNDLKKYTKFFVMGGGSNLLFVNDFKGIIIYPNIKGIKKLNETNDYIWLKAGCGENWDDFVEYCVNNNYGGIENLTNIPGNVGAVPVQNIGAYGVEVKDVIEKVLAVEIETGNEVEFLNSDCRFEYRDSIFKNELKNKYIITEVIFKLNKKPQLVTSYGRIEEEMRKNKEKSIASVRKAVLSIRLKKLPDYKKTGNAGSFFKNPIVEKKVFDKLKNQYQMIPFYNTEKENRIKISAAWLIEQCGWKGYRKGNVGVYHLQPLVIVNYGEARGNEIYQLSENIKKSVLEKFNIELECEVLIIK